jgi:Tol biopolymer transport system component
MAQRLNVSPPALTGEPKTLAETVAVSTNYQTAVSVATTGLIVYRAPGGAQRQLTWFDRSGMARGVVGDPDDAVGQPRISPDGRRVVVARTIEGNQDLWLLDNTRTTRFTFDPAIDSFPVWSPDGTHIIFTARRTGQGDIYLKQVSGGGAEELVLASDQVKTVTSWSSDGRFLLFINIDPQTNADLWVLPFTGDRKPSVFLKTPFREAYPSFSPNGQWVAYHSNESGRPEIYVRPFIPPGAASTNATSATGQWQVSTAGGIMPVWRSDGKEIFYIDPAGKMIAAPIAIIGSSLEPGAPVVLFPTHIVGGGVDNQQGRQYDVTPDGRFLINTQLNDTAAPITLLQNWNPESNK